MSRGLGTGQHLLLSALASLEDEHGSKGGCFYVWAIVDRAYALSPSMQRRHHAATEASAAREDAIRKKAAEGDDQAALYLGLTHALRRTRRGPRARRTTPFWLTERCFNPSRVLASLESRGLVLQTALKGGGSAALTDAGRLIASQLSVGTSCTPFAAGEVIAPPETADV